MSSHQTRHVLIIGAGLTGLLIAHGLKKAGISYTIFETEAAGALRPREWTMAVHWGVPLMEKLLPEELSSRLISEACVDKTLDYVTPPLNGSRIYDGVTGEVLKELASEGKLLRVNRKKLRTLIMEGIDIQYDHSLTDIKYSEDGSTVTAHFANGQEHTGTLLVGADGPRSQVRASLFDNSPDARVQPLSGIVHLAATFSYRDAEKARFVRSAHPVGCIMLHPDVFCYLSMQDVADVEKPEDWTFMLFICWLGEWESGRSVDEMKKIAQAKAQKTHEPFRSAIQWIPEDVQLTHFDIGHWVATPWDTRQGRTTLAGDAAHPMPPYRGQGMNHAVQDAFNFVQVVRSLDDADRERSVQEYSDEVARRGREETVLSTKNAYMMLAYENFKESPYMRHGLSKQ